MTKPEVFYWDTSCFFDLLKSDMANHAAAVQIMTAARAGRATIVTSTVTTTEVAWLSTRHWQQLVNQGEEDLADAWQEAEPAIDVLWRPESPVEMVDPSDRITRRAAALVRRSRFEYHLNITPLDAIHVATAASEQLPMHTSDKKLELLNGRVPITIGPPQIQEPPML